MKKNKKTIDDYILKGFFSIIMPLNLILLIFGGLSFFKTPFDNFFEICLQISTIMIVFEAIFFIVYMVLFIRDDFYD